MHGKHMMNHSSAAVKMAHDSTDISRKNLMNEMFALADLPRFYQHTGETIIYKGSPSRSLDIDHCVIKTLLEFGSHGITLYSTLLRFTLQRKAGKILSLG